MRRDTVVGERNAFLENWFPRLRKLGHCVVSCCQVLSISLHDIYAPLTAPPTPALIDRVDAREKRRGGDRAHRGLPELSKLPELHCCELECNKLPMVCLIRDWKAFEAATCVKEEREVILTILWNAGLAKISSRCRKHLKLLLGTSDSTYYGSVPAPLH